MVAHIAIEPYSTIHLQMTLISMWAYMYIHRHVYIYMCIVGRERKAWVRVISSIVTVKMAQSFELWGSGVGEGSGLSLSKKHTASSTTHHNLATSCLHSYMYRCTYDYTHTYIHAYIHTYIHTYSYIQLHTVTYSYIQLHTVTYSYIQLHTVTYSYIQLHTVT